MAEIHICMLWRHPETSTGMVPRLWYVLNRDDGRPGFEYNDNQADADLLQGFAAINHQLDNLGIALAEATNQCL